MQPSSSWADTSTGVNSVTGEGLKKVLTRADAVVDVTNSPSFEDNVVLEFFRISTEHLLITGQIAPLQCRCSKRTSRDTRRVVCIVPITDIRRFNRVLVLAGNGLFDFPRREVS